MKLISQLIFNLAFQEFFKKYVNGTAILPLQYHQYQFCFINLSLNFNDLDSVRLSSFYHYNIAINFLMFLNNNRYILLNYAMVLQQQDTWHYLLVRYLFQLYHP